MRTCLIYTSYVWYCGIIFVVTSDMFMKNTSYIVPNSSAFGGRGHIPLPHPPPIDGFTYSVPWYSQFLATPLCSVQLVKEGNIVKELLHLTEDCLANLRRLRDLGWRKGDSYLHMENGLSMGYL